MKPRALICSSLFVALFCLSCAANHPPVALSDMRAADRVVVETTYGPVGGFIDRGVATFLGMPYAKPPVGDLRFAPPQPPEKWTHLFPAVAYGPVANQPVDKTEASSSFFKSEDCLSVNVWTPGADGKRRPVIFYIHGGGFIYGGTADPLYDGEEFARRGDVVFVSANYRVGSFGFLYLDFLGDEFRGSGNNGLRDQIAALEWVKANIGRFGGDPDNVTIMGESAGSISVSIHLAAPGAKGLFRKAIAESGAPNITRSRAEAEQLTRVFMEMAGAKDAAGLRKLSAARMIEVQEKFLAKYGVEADLTFSPVIDGVVVPKDPFQAIGEGSAAGMPLLNGTTKDEFRYWIRIAPLLRLVGPDTFLKMATIYCRRLGDGVGKVIAHYQTAYPDKSGGDLSMMIATDLAFWYPHVQLSEAQAKHASVWNYQFAWPSPSDGGIYGAMHAVELPFVLYQLKSEPVLTGENPPVELARMMNDIWINFARYGVPKAAGLPDWPAYDRDKRGTMVLGLKPEVVYDLKRAERELYAPLLVVPK